MNLCDLQIGVVVVYDDCKEEGGSRFTGNEAPSPTTKYIVCDSHIGGRE